MVRVLTANLTYKELNLLIALQENPLATFDWLAKRIQASKSIVFSLMQKLSSRTNPYFQVVATTNTWNLGKEIVDILIEVDKEENLRLLEKLCYYHPYTIYRARSFGDNNGLLIQFSIPMGTKEYLKALFKKLQESDILSKFTLLEFASNPVIFSTPNVDFWDPVNHKWRFNWEEWFKKKAEKISIAGPEAPSGTAKKWLKQEDLAILREVVNNARLKNLEYIDLLAKAGYSFTPQTFSRKLKRLKEKCISGYRVYLNPNIFDLYSTVLIWGHSDPAILTSLQSKMLSHPIPFSSTFKINNDVFYWYLHLPPTHLSELLYQLRTKLTDMRFNYIDYVRAKTYLPWPPTFDEKKKDWRSDEAFMLSDILRELKIT